MRASTYRLVVVGSLLSAFMVGLHMPALHEIIEHGAAVQPSVLIATILLVVLTVIGGWSLLRQVPERHRP